MRAGYAFKKDTSKRRKTPEYEKFVHMTAACVGNRRGFLIFDWIYNENINRFWFLLLKFSLIPLFAHGALFDRFDSFELGLLEMTTTKLFHSIAIGSQPLLKSHLIASIHRISLPPLWLIRFVSINFIYEIWYLMATKCFALFQNGLSFVVVIWWDRRKIELLIVYKKDLNSPADKFRAIFTWNWEIYVWMNMFVIIYVNCNWSSWYWREKKNQKSGDQHIKNA